MKYELALAIKDKEDVFDKKGNLVHGRSKKGDIIAVRPYPFNWGTEAVKQFLIVIVDGLTEEEAKNLITPEYTDELVGELNGINCYKVGKKRRYKVDFNKLKTVVDIEETKLQEVTMEYQPLKDKVFEINSKGDLDLIYDKKDKKYKKVKK